MESSLYKFPEVPHGNMKGSCVNPDTPNSSSSSHESDPLLDRDRNEHKRKEHGTTELQTFVHLLKGNVGVGLLALPSAVKNAGLIVGPIGLLLMGIISTHCMALLVHSSRALCKKHSMAALNYAEVAQLAVEDYTNRRLYGRLTFYLVNVFLTITQFGFCVIYLVFIGDNVDQVMGSAFGLHLGARVWIAVILLPLVIMICLIRNLDDLASISLVANLCLLFCLGVILYEEIYQFVSHDPYETAAILQPDGKVNWGPDHVLGLALYFGSVIFAFEGIGVVLPVENRMKNPRNALCVVYVSMALVVVLYAGFGALGYMVYGQDIKSSITLSLNGHNRTGAKVVFLIVKLYYAFVIFATYFVQFYVPMDFLEPPLYKYLLSKFKPHPLSSHHHAKFLGLFQLEFRTALVVITAAIAIGIPDLGDLVTLVGAVASSVLALIFPPLFEMLVFGRKKRYGCLHYAVWFTKDILIILLGLVGSCFGTYAAIVNIVAFFGPHH